MAEPGSSPAPNAPPTSGSSGHTGDESVAGRHASTKYIIPITLALIAIAVFAASLYQPFRMALQGFGSILSPLLIACVIAYLCDPILTVFEYRLFRRMKHNGLRRGLSLLLTAITALGTLTLIGVLVIPQIYDSLVVFAGNIGGYIENTQLWLEDQLEYLPFPVDLDTLFGEDFDPASPLQGLLDKLAPIVTGGELSEQLAALLGGLINTFKNVLLGLIIAFYILASKEKRIAQIRKARAALLDEERDRQLGEVVSLVDNTFGGFIYGKLLDSLVIGILTLVMLLIFDVSEYKLLIALIVGIANIIPIFGPFIGAIPAFFIVLMSEPSKALLLLVLIFILQQLDGNVLAPKILGDNTGISSLCVIVAIAISSALWGIAGMIIGVPVFAVIIELIRRYLETRLERRGAPTDTLAYYPDDAIGNAEEEVYYEHSHLRYLYDHSKWKPRIDRFREWLFTSTPLRKKSPATPPPSESEASGSTEENDSTGSE